MQALPVYVIDGGSGLSIPLRCSTLQFEEGIVGKEPLVTSKVKKHRLQVQRTNGLPSQCLLTSSN